MNELFAGVLFCAAIAWLLIAYRISHINRFREELTPGQVCHFHINYDKFDGEIAYITEDGEVYILYEFGTYKTYLDNIYP